MESTTYVHPKLPDDLQEDIKNHQRSNVMRYVPNIMCLDQIGHMVKRIDSLEEKLHAYEEQLKHEPPPLGDKPSKSELQDQIAYIELQDKHTNTAKQLYSQRFKLYREHERFVRDMQKAMTTVKQYITRKPSQVVTCNMSMLAPIKTNWERRVNKLGRSYYLDHKNRTTSWFLPAFDRGNADSNVLEATPPPSYPRSTEQHYCRNLSLHGSLDQLYITQY